jgi:GDP-4-dehydro-6-deoxy-D-mannose reductase
MRVLITGATGFVGTHLRRYLLNRADYSIVGTVYPDPPDDPKPGPREDLRYLDLCDAQATAAVLSEVQPDAIIHLAAQSHVPTAYRDPWGTLRNNILGELNLLEACVAGDVAPRILIVGSGEEYGRAGEADLPLTEDHPLCPENPYSVSKVAQDVMGYQYFISYGLPVMRVRPFNHVGPGQSPRFVLPAFASQVAEIEAGRRDPILNVGNLDPARDFTDVRDVVAAYELILRRGTPGEVYNVASGRAHTVRTLVDQLIALVGEPIEIRTDPDRYRPADIPIIYGSAGKLQRDTGWEPLIPLAHTIRDVLNEWRLKVGSDSTAPRA